MLTLFSQSCVEPFEAATEDFESVLVIDALITNELKYQQINLSRTFRFEEEEAGGEVGATVRVLDDMQNEYVFVENNPGQYVSEVMFAAQPNVSYQLSITTREGGVYESTPVVLSKNTPIDDLYASVETNDQEVEGVAILVDTFDPEGESQYYRFDYEETYKIVAPFWNPQELTIQQEVPLFFRLVPKMQEEQVCFNTVNSVNIILANTSGFIEDRLSRFVVRFLARDDYIISHRYSILVKQYVISREAHTFYETLNEFSGLESIFSENQPGFFNGNISASNNPREKVIGFFDVSPVDSRRIFFDHDEFFPEDLIPAWPFDCQITTPIPIELLNLVKFEIVEFWAHHEPEDASQGDYKVVPRICGDCTVLGTNVAPDFWIE
ncbi:DUF4249 domain-containing protein [Allomuricauda sp. SCSIO 65647]|uniref:DUF4249 domain-containing protein n=1 Tax=Allomuricauda sp. SCSIO 65647 TaxID=2908843 RepID=UPI001F4392F2|nr:DUF4249 domain-containing protein [Muricauda sp. SCSIO 65647]UJH66639.1 DUF4249 domain-containing protein [Muricauda sp. SCSIO 65647]